MQYNLKESHDSPLMRFPPGERGLRQALSARERFLERHPHLRAYQAAIDRVLDQSGNTQGRMAVLGTLMQGKLLELQDQFAKLNRPLQ